MEWCSTAQPVPTAKQILKAKEFTSQNCSASFLHSLISAGERTGHFSCVVIIALFHSRETAMHLVPHQHMPLKSLDYDLIFEYKVRIGKNKGRRE